MADGSSSGQKKLALLEMLTDWVVWLALSKRKISGILGAKRNQAYLAGFCSLFIGQSLILSRSQGSGFEESGRWQTISRLPRRTKVA